MESCDVDEVTDPADWSALISRVEQPHITQSWAYGEAKQAASTWRTRRVAYDAGGWRARRVVFSRHGEPLAICQFLDKSLAGVASTSRVNRGPLFLDADPSDDVVRGIYGALRRHVRRRRGVLVMAPALLDSPDNHRMLSGLGYRPRHAVGWCSDRVDLRPDEYEIQVNLSKDWRRGLRRAEEAGVEFRVCESDDDLEGIIEQHVQHMKEKDFVGMNPAFLRALRDAAPEDFVGSQALLAGDRVGGLLTYRFGRVAEGLIFWTGQEGRRVNAARYLDWHTALEMRRRGCSWLDLGGKRVGATDTYKGGMGGAEYRLLNEWIAF